MSLICLENQGWTGVAVGDQARGVVGGRVVMQGILGLWIFLPVEWETTGECEAEEWHFPVSSFLNCIIAPILKVRKLRFRKVERAAHLCTACAARTLNPTSLPSSPELFPGSRVVSKYADRGTCL